MKKHDYLYNRRGYGAHIKLDPLVGKSPASAGVPPQTNKATVINSQSLLKGSGYYPKKVATEVNGSTETSSVIPPPPPPAPKSTNADEVITIHVCDERKKIDKDFKCK